MWTKRVINLLLLAFTLCYGLKAQHKFRAASYNIRYAAQADEQTGNGWGLRKQPLANLILKHRFDLIGTQEGDASQLRDLAALLPGYRYLGHPYGGSDGQLHTCATFYKTDQFQVLDSGVFWFSETPDVPSIGWDASDRRICYWIKFREQATQREFFFFNVHFYWRKQVAKTQSGVLLARKIQEIAGTNPIICTGDFNSVSDSPQIQAVYEVLSDAYTTSNAPPQGPEGTGFPGGVFQGEPGPRIDYLLVSKHFNVEDYHVFTDSYGADRYPSDHLPVASTLTWISVNQVQD